MNPLLALLLAAAAAVGLWVTLLFAQGLLALARRRRLAREACRNARPLRLVVQARQDHTGDLFSLMLADPRGRRLPAFKPGQHILLVTPAGKRAYSLAAWQPRPRFYELGIKRESHGAVSRWAHAHLHPGVEIDVLPPRGEFVLAAARGTVVLVGGGIGITPMRAMWQWLARRRQRALLVYAAREPADLLWHGEFSAHASADQRYHPILSRADAAWAGAQGRIDAQRLLALIDPSERAHAQFYLCASNGLMDALRADLAAAGVRAAQVHWEAFGVAAGAGQSGQRIALADGRAFIAAGEPTLLACLEANGIALPCECRAGSCGQCRVRLAEGEVRWLLAPEIALGEHEILPCCCVADTDCLIAVR